MREQLGRLLQYDDWANRVTLESLNRGNSSAKSLRWMAHIIAAEWLWLSRLRSQASPLSVWPDLSLSECGRQLDQLAMEWADYLESLAERQLTRGVSYTNSKGERWTSSIEEILTHVIIHSAYHRGQIASDVRTAGGEPAYTDYIHAVRQGLLT